MTYVRSGLCLALVCTVAFIGTHGRKLPSFIHQCSSKYPEVNRCLMKAIADIKPHLPRGIPEMHIPPLEPMKITETSLSSGESLVANFKNVEIKKISDFALDEVDFDVGRNTAAIKIRFPVLEFYSDYRIVGKILVLQLDGTGKSYGNASDVVATAVVTGKRKVSKGKEHILFDKINLDLKFGGGWMHFDDLFKGNRELSVRLNEVLNNSFQDVLEEVKPLIEHATGEIILGLIRGVFERYSIDELFSSG